MDLLVSRGNHEEAGRDKLKPRNNEWTATRWFSSFFVCEPLEPFSSFQADRRPKQAGVRKPQLKPLDQCHHICHDKKPQPSGISSRLVTREGNTGSSTWSSQGIPKSQSFCRRLSQLFTTSDSVCSDRQKSAWFTRPFLVSAKVFSHTTAVIINSFQKQNCTWCVKMSYLSCKSLSYKLPVKVHYWQRWHLQKCLGKEESYWLHTEQDNTFKQYKNADRRGRERKAVSNWTSSKECFHTNTMKAHIQNSPEK